MWHLELLSLLITTGTSAADSLKNYSYSANIRGGSCLWAWVILTHTPHSFSRVNCVKSLLLSIIASG